jgi:hypothetical protein
MNRSSRAVAEARAADKAGSEGQVSEMDVDRGVVVDGLRRAGYSDAADEVVRSLPERVDRAEVLKLLEPYGIHSLDNLISQMGGSS